MSFVDDEPKSNLTTQREIVKHKTLFKDNTIDIQGVRT